MKYKQLKVTTLAAALALSLSATAMAGSPAPGGGGGNPPGTDEVAANSDTTISIFESSVKNPNISYTVPLYVTLAVVNGQTDVKTPTNYAITNTTSADDPAHADTTTPKIGVTNMSLERLSATAFKTVETAPATDKKEIMLTIGGETMPAVSDVNIVHSFTPKSSTFFKDGKTVGLLGTVALPITGTVAMANDRTETATAAQFRVKYTVSLLDGAGQALGAVYAGDDRTAAGLPAFTK